MTKRPKGLAKDTVSKELIRELVYDMATYLLGLELSSLKELATERQRVEVRRADVVMEAESKTGERFVLHLELQNSHDAEMALRMLRYRTDIELAHPALPVRQYVIYTGREPCYLKDGLIGPGLDYRYRLIDMHLLDCERFMEADTPDALVMAILCDFRGQDERVVAGRIIRRIVELTGQDDTRLRKYLLMLETLSENRQLERLIQQLEQKMLTEMTYEKLPSYHLGERKGMQKGRSLGRQEGRQEGLSEVAVRMLQRGKAIEEVADLTGLDPDEVRRLAEQLPG